MTSIENQKNYRQIALRTSMITIVINCLLSVVKLTAGILGKSGAMISDAIHSISDVLSTVIVIIGINISSKKSDKEHQYGHERLECVVAIILSVILFATGVGIGTKGIQKILGQKEGILPIPGSIALAAAIGSILIKEWMYWYTRVVAKRIQSDALLADAWHHRSDALSSIGSFVGIFGSRLGYPILDPIASVVICLFIGKAAMEIFKDSIEKLIDKSCDDEVVKNMERVILEQEGVLEIDEIKTRLFGSKIYVDIEIAADERKTLRDSHAIAEAVHVAIEKEFGTVKHCMVHVNPKEINGHILQE